MTCRQCGKKLGLLVRLRSEHFCSRECQQEASEEDDRYSQEAVARLRKMALRQSGKPEAAPEPEVAPGPLTLETAVPRLADWLEQGGAIPLAVVVPAPAPPQVHPRKAARAWAQLAAKALRRSLNPALVQIEAAQLARAVHAPWPAAFRSDYALAGYWPLLGPEIRVRAKKPALEQACLAGVDSREARLEGWRYERDAETCWLAGDPYEPRFDLPLQERDPAARRLVEPQDVLPIVGAQPRREKPAPRVVRAAPWVERPKPEAAWVFTPRLAVPVERFQLPAPPRVAQPEARPQVTAPPAPSFSPLHAVQPVAGSPTLPVPAAPAAAEPQSVANLAAPLAVLQAAQLLADPRPVPATPPAAAAPQTLANPAAPLAVLQAAQPLAGPRLVPATPPRAPAHSAADLSPSAATERPAPLDGFGGPLAASRIDTSSVLAPVRTWTPDPAPLLTIRVAPLGAGWTPRRRGILDARRRLVWIARLFPIFAAARAEAGFDLERRLAGLRLRRAKWPPRRRDSAPSALAPPSAVLLPASDRQPPRPGFERRGASIRLRVGLLEIERDRAALPAGGQRLVERWRRSVA